MQDIAMCLVPGLVRPSIGGLDTYCMHSVDGEPAVGEPDSAASFPTHSTRRRGEQGLAGSQIVDPRGAVLAGDCHTLPGVIDGKTCLILGVDVHTAQLLAMQVPDPRSAVV